MYEPLKREDRAVLAHLVRLKLPQTQIAEQLGVHRTTVYRELKRNSGPAGYQAEEAQQRTDSRRWVWRTRKMDDVETREYVCDDHGRPIRLPVARGSISREIPGAASLGKRFTPGSTNNESEDIPNGATACGSASRGENRRKPRGVCRAPSRSKDVPASSICGVASAIGKETRSSVAIDAAAWSPWSNARAATRCCGASTT